MFNDKACFFSLQLPSLWFFCDFVGLDNNKLRSVRISPDGGFFTSQNISAEEDNISSFMFQQIKAFNDRLDAISEKQQEVISNNIKNNIDKFQSSKSAEAIEADIRINNDI